MSKKLITACLALVALAAFALPAGASAAKITHPTGTVLNPETGSCTSISKTICLLGTNTKTAIFRTGNTIISECSTVRLTGYLTKNNGTTVEGDIHTATFSGTGPVANGMNECTQLGGATATTNGTDPVGTKIDEEDVENGTPWCMKSVAEKDEFEVRGGTCKEAAREIRFILDSTTAGACTYGRVAAIVGEITTDEPEHDATVLLKPGASTEMTKKAGGILCPASGNLEMEFTLETDEATAKPVYFSK